MPAIEWDETFSVQVEAIDRQHKKLIDIINTLHEAIMEGEPEALRRVKEQTLSELETYGRDHFALEEDYMRSIDYPDLPAHREEHEKFLTRVSKISEEFLEASGVRNTEIMRMLKTWLYDHLLGEDQKYSRFRASA